MNLPGDKTLATAPGTVGVAPPAFAWLNGDRLVERLRAWHERWVSMRNAQRVIWVIFLVLAIATFAARGIVAKQWVHDLFFVFDAMWRVTLGQWPWRDFHSPIGIGFYLPFKILSYLEPFSLRMLLHANLIVAAAMLGLASVALKRRYSPLLFVLAALGPMAVALSPRSTDKGIWMYSMLAPYNRWSEAATMLIALVALSSRTPGRAGTESVARGLRGADLPAALAIALPLLFVLHLKIPYFLIGLGMVVVGLAAKRLPMRCAVLAGGILIVGDLLVELVFHNHLPYFADLKMAAAAASVPDAGGSLFKSLDTGALMFVRFSLASLLLLLLATYQGRLRPWIRAQRRTLAMAGSALFLAYLANTQNHWQTEIPMMCSVLLAVAETARREWLPGGSHDLRGAAFAAVVLVASKSIPTKEMASVVAHAVESRGDSVCPLADWSGTPAERLLFPKSALVPPGEFPPYRCDDVKVDPNIVDIPMGVAELDFTRDARVEAARLTAARALLGPDISPSESIFAFAFTNPYPAFTGSTPPRGVQLWWDYGRSYSRAARPDPEVILGTTDKVLVSRFDPHPNAHGGNMTRVYSPELIKDFRPVAQNRLWQLWVRRVPR